jgi:TetR/AcrR family transcriptional regulator, transcriptional repressor of bet genes
MHNPIRQVIWMINQLIVMMGKGGTFMARPTNTDQRRSEILEAFLSVMADKGYAKATIQAIAAQAELKPGLIHYHFSNKQEMLIELVKQVSAVVQQRYESLAQTATSPQEKLKAFIDARLAKGEGENPKAVAAWVVIGTEAIRQAEVRSEYEKVIASQQQLLEHLIAAASPSKRINLNTKKLAAICLATMEGAFKLSVSAPTLMPDGYAAETLYKLLSAQLG